MVRTSPSTAGCVGLIPDQGAKIPHAFGQKKNKTTTQKNKKQYFNKFNKDFKKDPRQKEKKNLKEK